MESARKTLCSSLYWTAIALPIVATGAEIIRKQYLYQPVDSDGRTIQLTKVDDEVNLNRHCRTSIECTPFVITYFSKRVFKNGSSKSLILSNFIAASASRLVTKNVDVDPLKVLIEKDEVSEMTKRELKKRLDFDESAQYVTIAMDTVAIVAGAFYILGSALK